MSFVTLSPTKTLQSDMNTYDIEQSVEFSALSAYIAELTTNSSINLEISEQEKQNVRILLNNLLGSIANLPRDYIMTQENTKSYSTVFHHVTLALDLVCGNATDEASEQKLQEMQIYQRSILKSLSQNLGLPDVKTQLDFITNVKSIQVSRDELVYDLINTFNLPVTTTPSEIVAALQGKFNEASNGHFDQAQNKKQLDSIKSQLETKNNALNRKEDIIKQLQNKVIELQDAVALINKESQTKDSQISQLQSRINTISGDLERSQKKNSVNKRTIDQLSKSNTDLQNQLNQANNELQNLRKLPSAESKAAGEIASLKKNLEHAEEEKNSLLKLLDDFTVQLEQQADELNEETDNRMSLIIAVQKLTTINEILEKEVEKAHEEIKKVSNEKAKQQLLQHSQEISNKAIEEVISQAKDLAASSSNEELDGIFDQNKESTPQERLIDGIAALIARAENTPVIERSITVEDEEKPKDDTTKLQMTIKGLVSFIQDMAESGNISKWASIDESTSDARKKLLNEIRRINDFISENAIPLFEESTFIEYLGLNANVTDFQAKANEVLSQVQDEEDPKELFNLLTYAIISNDVLRRYASQAKMTVSHLSSSLKSLKVETQNQQKATEEKHYNEKVELLNELEKLKKENEDVTECVKNVKTILQNSATKDNDTNTIIRCIEEINQAKPELNENDYINELENVLRTKSNDYKALKEETDKKIEDLEDELEHYKKVLTANKEKAIEVSAQQLNEIEKIKTSLTDSEELINKLREEKEKLEVQVENSKNDIIKATAELRKELFNTKNELESLHDEHEQKMHALTGENSYLKKTMAEVKASTDRQLLIAKKAMKKEIQRITQQSNAKQAEYEEAILKQKADNDNLTEKLHKAEDENKQITESLNNAVEYGKEKENEIAKINLEQKLLKTKLTSFSDKLKRNNSVFESQMKLKLFAMETESRSKIDTIKSECSKKFDLLLKEIYSTLEEFDNNDIPLTVDEENVLELIGTVAQIARNVPDLQQSVQQLQSEIFNIRDTLNISKSTRISNISKELEQKMKNSKDEIEKLTQENKQMKKDLIGMRSLAQQEKINSEWENWARKLHLQISDGEITIKSAREIRQSIEDLVASSCNDKSLWMKVESLRDEKKLIMMGAHNIQRKITPAKLNNITTALKFLCKIQKMSGYNYDGELTTMISHNNNITPQNSIHSEVAPSVISSKSKSPLFSQFVRGTEAE